MCILFMYFLTFFKILLDMLSGINCRTLNINKIIMIKISLIKIYKKLSNFSEFIIDNYIKLLQVKCGGNVSDAIIRIHKIAALWKQLKKIL